MSEEQKKELDKFADIAAKKKFHQVVCLAAAALMLNSSDWKKTIAEIIELAEESEDCDEFATKMFAMDEMRQYDVDDDFMNRVSDD